MFLQFNIRFYKFDFVSYHFTGVVAFINITPTLHDINNPIYVLHLVFKIKLNLLFYCKNFKHFHYNNP